MLDNSFRQAYTVSMNKLVIEKQVQIIKCLVEGNSLRSTSRMVGVSINTVTKLLEDIGTACLAYQDEALMNLTCKRIQCDEIWSFVYAKSKNVPEDHKDEFGYGDVWTWTAIDPDSKLVPCWMIGKRDSATATLFVRNLENRLANRVQLTTDGLKAYLEAIDSAFARNIDYAMLVKIYDQEGGRVDNNRRYSPASFTSADKTIVMGTPDPDFISTSIVERQNLTMRMSMRRFTRLTNAFSKKAENHMHAISLHFMYYNFARAHKSLANPYPRSPAMAAGVSDHIWSVEEILGLLVG